jgi:hypothetical protein
MPTIYLGRDAGLTWDGSPVDGVRDVSVTYTGQTFEVRPFGSRAFFSFQTGYAVDLIVETIDADAAATATTALQSGADVAVVAGGHTFTAIVTSVADAQPLDGVRAWAVAMTKTQAGLRS